MMAAKKESAPGSKKEKKEPTAYFSVLVGTWLDFYEATFGLRPSFDGSAPRDLKCIMDAMKQRSEAHSVSWTEDLAKAMLNKFLEFAVKEKWLYDNFFLFNLNRQKDKIFLKIKSEMDGKSNSEGDTGKQRSSYKTAGQEVFADRLRDRLNKLQ